MMSKLPLLSPPLAHQPQGAAHWDEAVLAQADDVPNADIAPLLPAEAEGEFRTREYCSPAVTAGLEYCTAGLTLHPSSGAACGSPGFLGSAGRCWFPCGHQGTTSGTGLLCHIHTPMPTGRPALLGPVGIQTSFQRNSWSCTKSGGRCKLARPGATKTLNSGVLSTLDAPSLLHCKESMSPSSPEPLTSPQTGSHRACC